jgi:pilus assembly protein Flp/PilA
VIETPLGAAKPSTKGFGRADTGATAIEYALIAALVSIFILSALMLTGNSLTTMYNVISNAMIGAYGN